MGLLRDAKLGGRLKVWLLMLFVGSEFDDEDVELEELTADPERR